MKFDPNARKPALAYSHRDVQPYMADQKLDTTFRYWEGMVSVTGTTPDAPATDRGHVELVGYTGAEVGG